jgi:hypothetical protein
MNIYIIMVFRDLSRGVVVEKSDGLLFLKKGSCFLAEKGISTAIEGYKN